MGGPPAENSADLRNINLKSYTLKTENDIIIKPMKPFMAFQRVNIGTRIRNR